MAHRIAIMDQGGIVQVGTPDEIYEQPATRFAAAFVGFVNLIEEIAYLGSHSVMHIRLPTGLKLLAHVPNSRRWASEDFTWEDRVWASWDDMAGVVLSS